MLATFDATRLYCEEVGARPAVILIHGFTLDTRMWEDQFPVLAQRYRVIRYDLRGFGRSARPDFQAIAVQIGRDAPQARTVVVPGAGHMANMEAPDVVNRALLALLNEHAPV